MRTTTKPTPEAVAPRGAGLVYDGSVTEARGLRVIELSDCPCDDCARLSQQEPPRTRVRAILEDGSRLLHARPWSFLP